MQSAGSDGEPAACTSAISALQLTNSSAAVLCGEKAPEMSITLLDEIVQFLSPLQLQGYISRIIDVCGTQRVEELILCVRCEKDVENLLGERSSLQQRQNMWKGLCKYKKLAAKRLQQEMRKNVPPKRTRVGVLNPTAGLTGDATTTTSSGIGAPPLRPKPLFDASIGFINRLAFAGYQDSGADLEKQDLPLNVDSFQKTSLELGNGVQDVVAPLQLSLQTLSSLGSSHISLSSPTSSGEKRYRHERVPLVSLCTAGKAGDDPEHGGAVYCGEMWSCSSEEDEGVGAAPTTTSSPERPDSHVKETMELCKAQLDQLRRTLNAAVEEAVSVYNNGLQILQACLKDAVGDVLPGISSIATDEIRVEVLAFTQTPRLRVELHPQEQLCALAPDDAMKATSSETAMKEAPNSPCHNQSCTGPPSVGERGALEEIIADDAPISLPVRAREPSCSSTVVPSNAVGSFHPQVPNACGESNATRKSPQNERNHMFQEISCNEPGAVLENNATVECGEDSCRSVRVSTPTVVAVPSIRNTEATPTSGPGGVRCREAILISSASRTSGSSTALNHVGHVGVSTTPDGNGDCNVVEGAETSEPFDTSPLGEFGLHAIPRPADVRTVLFDSPQWHIVTRQGNEDYSQIIAGSQVIYVDDASSSVTAAVGPKDTTKQFGNVVDAHWNMNKCGVGSPEATTMGGTSLRQRSLSIVEDTMPIQELHDVEQETVCQRQNGLDSYLPLSESSNTTGVVERSLEPYESTTAFELSVMENAGPSSHSQGISGRGSDTNAVEFLDGEHCGNAMAPTRFLTDILTPTTSPRPPGTWSAVETPEKDNSTQINMVEGLMGEDINALDYDTLKDLCGKLGLKVPGDYTFGDCDDESQFIGSAFSHQNDEICDSTGLSGDNGNSCPAHDAVNGAFAVCGGDAGNEETLQQPPHGQKGYTPQLSGLLTRDESENCGKRSAATPPFSMDAEDSEWYDAQRTAKEGQMREVLRLFITRHFFMQDVAAFFLHRLPRFSGGSAYKRLRVSDFLKTRFVLTQGELEEERRVARVKELEEMNCCVLSSLAGDSAERVERQALNFLRNNTASLGDQQLDSSLIFDPNRSSSQVDNADQDELSLYEKLLLMEPTDVHTVTGLVQTDFPHVTRHRVETLMREAGVPIICLQRVHNTQGPADGDVDVTQRPTTPTSPTGSSRTEVTQRNQFHNRKKKFFAQRTLFTRARDR
ncbi:uncharacterized protein TEOVI_000575500 [Trypanosoma equiperdum]|uniref:Uncharacterized protein n=1 Tax=Trypanosoma equiperdum TaxID=5694 RepID=A0A1G4I4C6_TRYEQ|nr:hypothetical protein, conserved [Trypanosoma equiperdum]